MAILTAEMKETVDLLIEKGVLRSVGGETEYLRFCENCRRTIFVGCPDCDQLKDAMVFHGTKIGEKFHPIAPVHGGGSAFHPHSLMIPIPFPYAYFLHEIKRASKIKNTKRISFYSHTPCAAAGEAGLTIPQLIELQLYNRGELDRRLQQDRHPMDVVPYFHVDFGATRGRTSPGKKDKRTFVVSREAWFEIREAFWNDHIRRIPFRLTELTAA